MNVTEVEKLVGELLATGEMNTDTQADLERIAQEARNGQSHEDDIDYLRALHARVLSPDAVRVETAEYAVEGESVSDLHRQIAALQAELDEARQTIARLEAQLAPTP